MKGSYFLVVVLTKPNVLSSIILLLSPIDIVWPAKKAIRNNVFYGWGFAQRPILLHKSNQISYELIQNSAIWMIYMQFSLPLTKGRLIRRYKRFLADVELADGNIVVAHCANSGSMLGCQEPGSMVYLSPNQNPKAKLDWRWELIDVDGALVGINTSHPNRLVEAAIADGTISELQGYGSMRREVKYGQNSRIDILLEDPGFCYVEVKNVTLKIGNEARFPDAVTARGTKHLMELSQMVADGHRAVMVYLVQREDCSMFRPASDIDPAYANALKAAQTAGVEIVCYACNLSPSAIEVVKPMPYSIYEQ